MTILRTISLIFFCAFFLFPSDGKALSCIARPIPAYFQCGEQNCSLLFAVKRDLEGRWCERHASGFYSTHEGFEKISAGLLESGKLHKAKVFQVDLSFSCRFFARPGPDGKWRPDNVLNMNGRPDHDATQKYLSSAFSDCVQHSTAKESTLEAAEAERAKWAQEIKTNHLNEAAQSLYFFLAAEILFWFVRYLAPSRLFGLSIFFFFLPLAHFTIAPVGGLQYSLTYLLWPIFWLRTTVEGLQPNKRWRRAAHLIGVATCCLLLAYLFYRAFSSSTYL